MENSRNCPSCKKPLPADAVAGLCPECLLKSGFNTGTEPVGQAGSKQMPPPSAEDLCRLFPQLEVLELIGQGGMGVVYKARQPLLNRFVALKVLTQKREGDPQFAQRFTREAQTLARLNHANIVAVHDFGEVDGLYYLIMEYIDGVNLRSLLRSRKINPEEALAIVPHICDALQYAHEQGVVHRDIKPENILLDKQGHVKIADFGIAKILGAPSEQQFVTGTKDVVGTPHYMAPEQVEKPSTVDHRADIYSLGVVFYEMLTGELPLGKFSVPSNKVEVDVRLDEVVLRALEKEPQRRYQQAEQVKSAVETIAKTPPPAPPPVRPELSDDTGKPQIPPLLWVGIVSLGLMVFGKVLASFKSPIVLVDAALSAVLLGGIYCGARWAYFLTIVSVAAGTLMVAGKSFSAGVAVFLVDCLVLIPVLLCKDYFFDKKQSAPPFDNDLTIRRRPSKWLSLAVPLSMLLVPPLGFLVFLLSKSHFGMHLDADTQLIAGLLGFPLAGILGALLGGRFWRGVMMLSLGAGAKSPLNFSQRWPWQSIVAVIAFIISLPLGSGAAVMGQLILQDGSWHPAGSELVFTLCIVGGFACSAIASTWFGLLAWNLIRHTDAHPLSSWPALMASSFWPGLLALTLLVYPFLALAPNPNIEVVGMVVDAASYKPILGARVADVTYNTGNRRGAHEAWTDAAGKFRLHTWNEEHDIQASAPGYETKTELLKDGSGKFRTVVFELRPLKDIR